MGTGKVTCWGDPTTGGTCPGTRGPGNSTTFSGILGAPSPGPWKVWSTVYTFVAADMGTGKVACWGHPLGSQDGGKEGGKCPVGLTFTPPGPWEVWSTAFAVVAADMGTGKVACWGDAIESGGSGATFGGTCPGLTFAPPGPWKVWGGPYGFVAADMGTGKVTCWGSR
eukprot:gene7219-59889_t